MTDATTEFFDDLDARGHEPLLEKATGTVRIDLSSGKRTGPLARDGQEGRRDCVPRQREGRLCYPYGQGALRTDRRPGEKTQLQPCCGGWSLSRATRSCSCSFSASSQDRRTEGSSRERARSDPRRQHLRGQRLARRHRGVADGSDRPLLVRQPLPLDVDPDRGRRAAESALGRRSAVLRIALLPRAGHRNGLRRRQDLGDSPARGRRRVPRRAHDPEPRRQAGRPQGSHRRCQRFRRPVRGQGCAGEEGALLRTRSEGPPPARLRPRVVQAPDRDLGDRTGQARQEGPEFCRSHRASR